MTGHYMFIESSSLTRQSDRAQLVSPVLSWSSSESCLQFWYNMYGSGMGTMTIKTAHAIDHAHTTPVWTMSGDQGQGWHKANVTIHTTQPIQVLYS
jgi:hypothetical protein